MDLISVIVPVFRVRDYLERCVKSIINQTYKNIEIILVNDGCPDGCGELCDYYRKQDNRIKVIHKKNGGLSEARNVGIENARGDFYMFVDSDDWIDLNMIELLYKILMKYKADIVECSYRSILKGKDIPKEETNNNAFVYVLNPEEALEGMLEWKYFKPVVWNKLYKKEIMRGIKFPLKKIHEDEFTTYKYILNSKKLVYIDVSKYNYDRTREDSITGKAFDDKNLDVCFAMRERVDYFYEYNVSTRLQQKMNDFYCWILLDRLYKAGKDEIQGERLESILCNLKSDIEFFSKYGANKKYLEDLKKIRKEGLRAYIEYREKMNE